MSKPVLGIIGGGQLGSMLANGWAAGFTIHGLSGNVQNAPPRVCNAMNANARNRKRISTWTHSNTSELTDHVV